MMKTKKKLFKSFNIPSYWMRKIVNFFFLLIFKNARLWSAQFYSYNFCITNTYIYCSPIFHTNMERKKKKNSLTNTNVCAVIVKVVTMRASMYTWLDPYECVCVCVQMLYRLSMERRVLQIFHICTNTCKQNRSFSLSLQLSIKEATSILQCSAQCSIFVLSEWNGGSISV